MMEFDDVSWDIRERCLKIRYEEHNIANCIEDSVDFTEPFYCAEKF